MMLFKEMKNKTKVLVPHTWKVVFRASSVENDASTGR